MSLFKNIFNILRWYLSVVAKFSRVVPGHTLAVVLVTLVSQVSMLLAFLLPLKIIMLLGSPGIPRYFPRSFMEFDREQLVIWLSITAIAFYIVYQFAERLIGYWSDRGAQLLLQKSQKITLFENQEEVATSAYQRYARCLAGAVFVGLTLMVLGIIYPELALLVLGYGAIVFVLLALLYSVSRAFHARLEEGLGKLPGTVGSVGFLLAFTFMVMDFLFGTPPGVLVAIISIILIRQALNRLTALTKDLEALNKQRLKINALFFHGHALVNEPSRYDHGFWSLLEPGRRGQWMTATLANIAGIEICRLQAFWHQTGVPDVVAFDVRAFGGDDSPLARYLLKLFNIKRRGQAVHEATLFMAFKDGGLPAPRFLGTDQVEGYNCHVFEVIGGDKPSPREVRSGIRFLQGELWSIEPPKDIVNRFRRSRPLLPQRLNGEVSERLLVAANDAGTVADVKCFAKNLDMLREILSALPLCIYNPDLGADTLLKVENDEFVATHWGRWSLEPIGAGWPIREKEWELLPEYFARAAEKRPALAGVAVEEVRLAALVFAFERLYQRQRYVSAIELLPGILECVEPARKDVAVND